MNLKLPRTFHKVLEIVKRKMSQTNSQETGDSDTRFVSSVELATETDSWPV